MTLFLITAFFFMLGWFLMSIGLLMSGKRLKGSCGGKTPDENDLLGNCICSRKEADICASEDGNELVMLAELGNPKRNPHNGSQIMKLNNQGSSIDV